MNDDTLTLIHRPYGDLVNDLLTAIVGGVVNEPIRFDIKLLSYPLAEPSTGVRSITGLSDDERRSFLPDIDFVYNAGSNTVLWLEEGTLPDDDTIFSVDYLRVDSRSPLTDTNIGSVTRTLSEAIGREIATVYGTINLAYLSGFIDTAQGRPLDYVVSILGVTRKTAEFAEGLVTFFRSSGVAGNVTVPAGLRLATSTGNVLFVTAQQRTLQDGQVRIDVPVRAADGFAGDDGLVDAGTVTEQTQPVAGVDRITNFDPTVRAAADETDDELRMRARAALRGLGQATIAALDRVIREGRGTPVEFFDPNSPPANRSAPGHVAIVLDAEPERLPGITAAVHQTRAAGVAATLIARYVFITPRVKVTITPGLSNAGQLQVSDDIIAALQAYIDGLTQGDSADGSALLEAMTEVDDVVEATIRDVIVRKADLSSLDQESLVDQLVDELMGLDSNSDSDSGSGSDWTDDGAIRSAVESVIDPDLGFEPTGASIPDRGLLLSTAEETAGTTGRRCRNRSRRVRSLGHRRRRAMVDLARHGPRRYSFGGIRCLRPNASSATCREPSPQGATRPPCDRSSAPSAKSCREPKTAWPA